MTAMPAKLRKPRQSPERDLEIAITQVLELDGWRSLKTDPVSDRSRAKGFGELGMADRLYFRYEYPSSELPGFRSQCRILWIEHKARKGKAKPHQIDWHMKERARGALTLIAGRDFTASLQGFARWYSESGLCRNGKFFFDLMRSGAEVL